MRAAQILIVSGILYAGSMMAAHSQVPSYMRQYMDMYFAQYVLPVAGSACSESELQSLKSLFDELLYAMVDFSYLNVYMERLSQFERTASPRCLGALQAIQTQGPGPGETICRAGVCCGPQGCY